MERNKKRLITYTIITVVFLLLAIKYDETIIGFVSGITYQISGFIVIMLLWTVIKDIIIKKERETL